MPRITSIVIKPEVIDPEDKEMLEDLIMAAVNDANRQVDEKLAEIAPQVPGGMF